MRIVFAPRAGRDLADTVDGLAARNRHAALVVAATIRKRVALLARHPFSGRAQDVADVRKIVTAPFGYGIYYAVDEAEKVVTVLAIRRPARTRPGAPDG